MPGSRGYILESVALAAEGEARLDARRNALRELAAAEEQHDDGEVGRLRTALALDA